MSMRQQSTIVSLKCIQLWVYNKDESTLSELGNVNNEAQFEDFINIGAKIVVSDFPDINILQSVNSVEVLEKESNYYCDNSQDTNPIDEKILQSFKTNVANNIPAYLNKCETFLKSFIRT